MKNLSPIDENKDVVTKEYVDPIKSQAALNRTTLGMQCKNLLKNTAETKTVNNVKFTVNSDGSITATQTTTAPGNATIYVATDITLSPGTYILTGDDEIKTSGFGAIRFYINGTIYSSDTAYTFDTEVTISSVMIFIWKGVNINGSKTVYPMLRYADITDSTYEPYTESIDERLIKNRSDIAVNRTTLGYQCKNLHDTLSVNWYQPGKTSVTSDGTVTTTMTSDPRSFTYANSEHYITLEAGNYIITANTLKFAAGSSALIRGCNSDNQSLFALSVSSAGLHKAAFSLSEKTTIGIMYKLYSQTCTIMIRDADILDDTYEPYQPSVQEQISYSLSVSGKSTSAAISYSGVPTLICLTPNTSDSTAGGLYMINSAGAVIKLIEKSGVVIAADATSKTFTITNNTATVMDVCVSRCWGR